MHRSVTSTDILRRIPTESDQLALLVSAEMGKVAFASGFFQMRNLSSVSQQIKLYTSTDPARVTFDGSGNPVLATFTQLGSTITIEPMTDEQVPVSAAFSMLGIGLVAPAGGVTPNLLVSSFFPNHFRVSTDNVKGLLRAQKSDVGTVGVTVSNVAATPLVIAVGAARVFIHVPAAHTATVNDGAGSIVLDPGDYEIPGIPGVTLTNVITVSRTTGSGNIQVTVTR